MDYKYFLSVCVCIKNEKKYINEFIKHYLLQGVDNVYIVNNGSDDGIESFVENSPFKNSITLINDSRDLQILQNNEGAEGHRRLLNDNLYDLVKRETKWGIFVDADEFMYGKNGETIKTYLRSLDENIGCVYVLWNIFNPVKPLIGEFSLKNNTKRVNYDRIKELSYEIQNAYDFGKSIVRTSMLNDNDKLWIHKIKTGGIRINNYGNIDTSFYDNSNYINYSEEQFKNLKLTMNHYAIRNIDDHNKKSLQLNNVSNKVTFIRGLMQLSELDDNMLITDTYVADLI
jgi:hypothetical protein